MAAKGLLRGRATTTTPTASPGDDRVQRLIAALIELSDKVSSRTLRAEVLAALRDAGVDPIEVRAGSRFDPRTMRGVGGATAPDAAWNGRVAATHRCGFREGATVLRAPDVIVYASPA